MNNYCPFNRAIFILLLLIVMVHGYGQTGLNFQGVARTNNNIILASQPISLRLSILQGSASGNAEYVETRRVTTNAQGLFTTVIGDTGAISTLGNFTTINWRNTPKFLKIEMDPAAGNNFMTMGTTQFQYVAYAQFANSVDAENITGVVPVARGGTGAISLSSFKTTLALDKVNNTTDTEKPISTKTQTALDLKLNASDTVKYTKQSWADSALLTKLNLKDTVKFIKQIYADSALLTKLKLSDTASMLSNRIGKDTLNLSARINVKANMSDLTTGLAIKLNAIDTSKYTKQNYADSALVTKLKLSDTASMLSNRIGKDTLNLSARINLKANMSDLTTGLATKVDKVSGRELSTNDYTTAEKTKLAAIIGTNTGDQDLSSYATTSALALKANAADLSSGLGLKANISDVTTSLLLKENAANKSTATDLGGTSPSDILFPTQKAVKEYVTANASSGGVADGGISTIKLADGAVTDAKVASGISKSKVGLSNVDNTSDAFKPISTATQSALDLKANLTDLQHSGDVTGTYSLTIAANAVTTNKIADANITYGKIQNLSSNNKVLGRVSVGSGIVEEISTTGTGNVVRATSPTLVTPNIGDATASRISVGTPAAASYTALEINSTTKGFLPPRLTKVERSILDGTNLVPNRSEKIPTGTTIYCTNCGNGELQIYDGIGWRNATGGATANLEVGDFALGGVVGYILVPGDNGYVEGVTKGVIIDWKSLDDEDYINDNITGYNGINPAIDPVYYLNFSPFQNQIYYVPQTSFVLGSGMENTNKIFAKAGNNGGAALFAYNYSGGGYTDWYLPSRDELLKIRSNEPILLNKLKNLSFADYQGHTEFISSSEDFYGPFIVDFWGQQDQGPVNYQNGSVRNYNDGGGASFMIIRSFAISKSGDLNNETSESIKSKLGITTLSGSNTGDQIITLTGDVLGTGTGSFSTTVNSIGGVSSSTISNFNSRISSNTNSITTNTSDIASLNSNLSAKQTGYTNLTSIGTLSNTAGYLKNNGSGAFSYTTPTTADISPSTNKNYLTDTQAGVLSNTSGINTGDETTSTIKTKLGITDPAISGNNNDQIQILTSSVGSGELLFKDLYDINTTLFDDKASLSAAQNIFTGDLKAKTYILTNPTTTTASTSTTTINLATGNVLEVLLNANTTLSFTNPRIGTYIIKIKQDGTGNKTVTFPTIKWADDAVPTITATANRTDLVTLIYDGTHYYATCLQNF